MRIHLECASTYKPPRKDDKGFHWNKALEHGAQVTAREVMMGGHGLCHKEPFVKLAALFVAEYTLLHYPKHLLHYCKLDRVSEKALKVHGSMGNRLPWSGDKLVPFQRATIGLDICLTTTKMFETMGVQCTSNRQHDWSHGNQTTFMLHQVQCA